MEHGTDAEQMQAGATTTPTADMRTYRAGVIAGVLGFIAFLGVVKDVNALLDPGGRGEFAWGFLMLRYSTMQRVWFGYRFTDHAAWLATFPHLILYATAVYALIGLKRWGWYLLFGYVVYISLSEWLFMFFYPLGYLTGTAYPDPVLNGEWFFLLISFPLELLAAGLLWWYRDLFVRIQPVTLKKRVSFGIFGSMAGFTGSYLFAPTVLGFKPPLSVYFRTLLAYLTGRSNDPMDKMYGEAAISTLIVCTIVGLLLGLGLGAVVDSVERKNDGSR